MQLTKVSAFWRDERGQDLIEYALMAGFAASMGVVILSFTFVPAIRAIMTAIYETLQRFT